MFRGLEPLKTSLIRIDKHVLSTRAVLGVK